MKLNKVFLREDLNTSVTMTPKKAASRIYLTDPTDNYRQPLPHWHRTAAPSTLRQPQIDTGGQGRGVKVGVAGG